jgi:hypothetical protein
VVRAIRGKKILLLINVLQSLQLENGRRGAPAKGNLTLASDRHKATQAALSHSAALRPLRYLSNATRPGRVRRSRVIGTLPR